MSNTAHITNNFAFLNRSFNGSGVKVHTTADGQEYVTLTFSKCVSTDLDFVMIDNPPPICYFRIMVGDANVSLIKKVEFEKDLTVPNIPVKSGQEIWIACNVINEYCVYGFAHLYPRHTHM
jgi:hypothetical protein